MKVQTQTIARAAIFTALTMVATMVVHIPIPQSNGYVNIGDAMIYITAFVCGPWAALVAGGVGSALADVILGYANWAPFSLVIKGLEGLICGLVMSAIFRGKAKSDLATRLMSGIGMLVGAIIMVGGYFLAGWLMYGSKEVSLVESTANAIQGAVSIFVAYLTLFVMKLATTLVNNRKNKE